MHTWHILVIADAGFFPHCLSFSSVKSWFSQCSPWTRRSAPSGYWLETQILRPLRQICRTRNSGEGVGWIRFLTSLPGAVRVHSSLRTTALRWPPFWGLLLLPDIEQGWTFIWTLYALGSCPSSDTKFSSVLASAAEECWGSSRILEAIKGHFGNLFCFVFFPFALLCQQMLKHFWEPAKYPCFE